MSGRVLVVTAVRAEADAIADALGAVKALTPGQIGPYAVSERADVTVLAGGVGPAAAAAATAAALALAAPGEQYTLVISAGIGGAIAGRAGMGEVVEATAIVAADLGVQTADGFHPVSELGFGTDRIDAQPLGIAAVRGPIFTVSTVTGTEERATELAARGGVVEAMEGFGVAVAASRFAVPVAEVRAISNAVGLRERERWDVPGALAALAEIAEALLTTRRPDGGAGHG